MAGEELRVEYAVGKARGPEVFPVEWGVPAGTAYSEERASWVLDHVRVSVRARPLSQLVRRRLEGMKLEEEF